jgi:hypothetical protein
MPEWFASLFSWDGIAIALNFFIPLFIAWLALMGYEKKGAEQKKSSWGKRHFIAMIWVAFGLSVFGAIVQLIVFAQHRASEAYDKTYNTDALHDYEDIFDSRISQRVSAATALKEYYQKGNWDLVTNSTDGLDYMLSFWEDVGYDEQRGKISAEVAWEGFYDDIEAYHQGAAAYIAKAQKDDPTYFENVQKLFDDVTKVAAQKRHMLPAQLRMSDKDYLEYLRSEIDLKK